MNPLRQLGMCLRSNSGLLLKGTSAPRPRTAFFHTVNCLGAHERSKNVGNPHMREHLDGKQSIPKWKLHWLYMMRRKAEIEEEEERPRSDQLNWNYESELEAFAYRLKIRVRPDVIRTAFTEPLNNDSSDASDKLTKTDNNEELFQIGYEFIQTFIKLYMNRAFPKMGDECIGSVITYLTSESLLSYLAQHLGYPDLVQSSAYPVSGTALYRCFLASIGAILSGPGGKIEAARFIYDFVVVTLIDKDLVHDIWKPKDPMRLLVKELEMRNISPPEVRLTKKSGINTVTPVFFVGLFCDRKLLSESGGESIIKAETDAAKLALKDLYDVNVDRYQPLVGIFSDTVMLEDIEAIEVSEISSNPEKGTSSLNEHQTMLKDSRMQS